MPTRWRLLFQSCNFVQIERFVCFEHITDCMHDFGPGSCRHFGRPVPYSLPQTTQKLSKFVQVFIGRHGFLHHLLLLLAHLTLVTAVNEAARFANVLVNILAGVLVVVRTGKHRSVNAMAAAAHPKSTLRAQILVNRKPMQIFTVEMVQQTAGPKKAIVVSVVRMV